MKGLIIKDILNLKKGFKTVLAMLVFYILWSLKIGDTTVLIGIITLLLTMMSITSMSYDDFARWDKYVLATPISRKKVVASKYILGIILSASGILLSTPIAYIITLFKGDMSGSQLILNSYIIFLISILFTCIILPLVYKFGVENSRMMMVAVAGIPMVIAYFMNSMGIFMPGEKQFILLLKLSPIIIVLCLLISSSISYGIYRNKDI